MYKTPSEKDFFGQPCLTPDCDGELIKIEVHDECGKLTTLQGDRLKEKFEEEENQPKGKSRLKREPEKTANQMRKCGKQQKKKSEIEQLPVSSSPSPKGEAEQSANKPCLDLTTYPVRF